MTTIKQNDFIDSIADALQYISYFHPPDFIKAMHQAFLEEESTAAKQAIGQILINSKLAAYAQRPICQDTGMVCVFLKIGMSVKWECLLSIEDMVNHAIKKAYMSAENPLRASIVKEPSGRRINTKDNTPGVIHTDLVLGNSVDIIVAAKGFGSENKAQLKILNPSDCLKTWVLETIPDLGAGWCPPGIVGIGIGGTADKAILNAKESLFEEPINIQSLYQKQNPSAIERLRMNLYEGINQLGIGAQGLGGLTTVLDVKIKETPTHAAALPVAIIPNCAATRYIKFSLDGSGPCQLEPPQLKDWPDIDQSFMKFGKKVALNSLNKKSVGEFEVGETLLISGTLVTGRDAAHKRLDSMIKAGKPLPKNLKNRLIYYVGPVPKVGKEIIGSAGPTTATRMDKFVDSILSHSGLIGMIGKAERGQEAIASIKRHQSVYLIAVGGAAYLISKSIKAARVIAFEDLGMEAIYELEVKDMPVIVAVDSKGNAIHNIGPKRWCGRCFGLNKDS